MNKIRINGNLMLLVVISAILLMGSCGEGKKVQEQHSVSELEQMIMTSVNTKESDSLSHLLIAALRLELKSDQDDKKIMENMFKIANLYYSLKDFDKAIDVCENIVKAYPNGEITPQAIFFEAVIYQFDKQMYGKANMLYDKLITQYPTSIQAQEAEKMIENLGLTEDELIKKFESNNSVVTQ